MDVIKESMNEYELIDAEEKDKERLIDYKLKTIYEYADNISENEKEKINNYVKNTIYEQLKNYKIIKINENKIGCILIYEKDDGVFLDEIYIDENNRNRGIGSDILKKILKENETVYLWVYKLNIRAIKLYKKAGFKILNKTETRYFMKYQKGSD